MGSHPFVALKSSLQQVFWLPLQIAEHLLLYSLVISLMIREAYWYMKGLIQPIIVDMPRFNRSAFTRDTKAAMVGVEGPLDAGSHSPLCDNCGPIEKHPDSRD